MLTGPTCDLLTRWVSEITDLKGLRVINGSAGVVCAYKIVTHANRNETDVGDPSCKSFIVYISLRLTAVAKQGASRPASFNA